MIGHTPHRTQATNHTNQFWWWEDTSIYCARLTQDTGRKLAGRKFNLKYMWASIYQLTAIALQTLYNIKAAR